MNISGEPLVKDNDEALERLSGLADFFLFHDRDIYVRTDDSVAAVSNGRITMLRHARGYAPGPVPLPHKSPSILAVGSDLKNTICLSKNSQAFVSQHIGDLAQVRTQDYFSATIHHMKRTLGIEPAIVAHDEDQIDIASS